MRSVEFFLHVVFVYGNGVDRVKAAECAVALFAVVLNFCVFFCIANASGQNIPSSQGVLFNNGDRNIHIKRGWEVSDCANKCRMVYDFQNARNGQKYVIYDNSLIAFFWRRG